ncbi:MAG: HEPN domain-containing protein [Chloroflexota bacterium]
MRWASEDIEGARTLLREAHAGSAAPRLACSLAQQSAEKALKAILMFINVDPPRIHNLTTLLERVPATWSVKGGLAQLAELTAWAIEARYPADLPEATLTQAEVAVAEAEEVLDMVERGLREHGLGDAGC